MPQYVYWFLLALILLGLEMASGTFYLLVLSVALAVGGLAALSGLGAQAPYVMAAIAAVSGIVLLQFRKGSSDASADGQSLDAGHQVKVLSRREDGTLRVFYRGAEWDAELDNPHAAHEDIFYIKKIQGSVLLLTHHKPH